MLELLLPALIGGFLTGGAYALVALGLTLIYGVLHIVNFAHGSLLMVAMFVAWILASQFQIDPLMALPLVTLAMFGVGWALYWFVIGRVSHGNYFAILLATLGVAVTLDNGALVLFTGDTRTIETAYSFSMLELGPLLIPVAKLIAFVCALVIAGLLWAFMALTTTGRAIRAVAKEQDGARLVGIKPQNMFALAYGIGVACLGAAACLLLPSFYVTPGVGNVFVLIAFTVVVLGGMGSFPGAVVGGLLIGVAESLGGLYLGESLGPICVPLVFIAVLLLRPTGLFGGAMRRLLPVLLVVVAVMPLFSSSQYLANLALLTATSAALGQSWNIASGFGGMTSFGHAAFFGLGAYATAILQTRYGLNPWLGLPAGILVGAVAGYAIGYSAFRAGLRGSYFALVTLAFAEAFRIISNSTDLTRAGLGILIPLKPVLSAFQFADRREAYAATLLLLAVTTACAAWLTSSRFGARLVAVRENEDAARALGVPVVRTKSRALALSAGLTAAGGVLYAQIYLYIDPNIAFSTERSVEMLLVAMIGGAGTVWGPILGAIVLHLVSDTSRTLISTPGFAPMLYGLLLLAIVKFLPGGVARLRRA